MIWAQRLIEKNFPASMTTAKNYSKPTCSEIQKRMDAEINLTNPAKNHLLWKHIKNCDECNRVWTSNLRVKESLRRVVKIETASDGLRQKIQDMIHKNNVE